MERSVENERIGGDGVPLSTSRHDNVYAAVAAQGRSASGFEDDEEEEELSWEGFGTRKFSLDHSAVPPSEAPMGLNAEDKEQQQQAGKILRVMTGRDGQMYHTLVDPLRQEDIQKHERLSVSAAPFEITPVAEKKKMPQEEGTEKGEEGETETEKRNKKGQVERDAEGLPVGPLGVFRDVNPKVKTKHKFAKMPPNPHRQQQHRLNAEGRPVSDSVKLQGKILEEYKSPQLLRVAAGRLRGRRLKSPNVYLRPMMSRVRLATFGILKGLGLFDGLHALRVLDLFSGSGGVGIEALSWGASSATFVDFSRDCCETAAENLEKCGAREQGRVVRATVEEVLKMPQRYQMTRHPADLVFVCPPYEEVDYSVLMRLLAESTAVADDAVIVIEYPVELKTMPPSLLDGKLVGLRNRRYGRTVIGIYLKTSVGGEEGVERSRWSVAARSEEFAPVGESRKVRRARERREEEAASVGVGRGGLDGPSRRGGGSRGKGRKREKGKPSGRPASEREGKRGGEATSGGLLESKILTQ
uniref:Uncharacterized protein n=1 Tax=Chromera velia CCMP2878 TaxID=1169474 RepID=A0A0G4HUA7_9ALVE|eukprot:Cvel_8611.t1-p1 / transcript=Cvel_8611.t1 / gene=Cvel_8611 / organism=Chromera_velia_CCMP2878 / gene_product=Putative rRNA methyltransferase YlbH, putative / transcript_product=Putative rRNA methyltransferase YlbH, putative / location=Cvel_scaffold478:63021-64598(+) / protein_length=526 / sequence_SO=supercontig / SO=protein_coding / is_pseudo=false